MTRAAAEHWDQGTGFEGPGGLRQSSPCVRSGVSGQSRSWDKVSSVHEEAPRVRQSTNAQPALRTTVSAKLSPGPDRKKAFNHIAIPGLG